MAVELPAIVVHETHVGSLASLPPSASRALVAFRETTGLLLVELPSPPPLEPKFDQARGARILEIERVLREARGPLDLGDASALSELRIEVAAAYGLARAHPEDPEAPFLVAEALRTLARVEDLAGDANAARALRTRADLLDGGRKIGLSEGAAADPPAEKTVSFAIVAPGAEVFVDGEKLEANVALSPGEHHLRVVREGRVVDARWFAAAPPAVAFSFPKPTLPCSREDLAGATSSESFTVACPRWARVRDTASGVEIRICGPTSCGSKSVWRAGVDATPAPKAPTPSVWRSPWTWAAVGTAAIVGGALTAWGLGAFDRKETPPPTWRWEGVR